MSSSGKNVAISLLFCAFRIFLASLNWRFFSEHGVTASLLRILLSTLADFNSVVVWVVSIFPLTSSTPSLFSKFLGTVPSAPNTIDITVTFMFHTIASRLTRYSFSFSLISLFVPLELQNQLNSKLFSFWQKLALVFWLVLGDLFISESSTVSYAFHFLG